ncbi:glutathione S-transferase [Burkholderiales bacterium]|nr:glutathione S-transferase [Burkholderiales bacterium]
MTMALVLYYGSGSPYAWRVQLALEAKGLPCERRLLSFSAGDTRKPEFVALNPRHRVPTIVDGDFVLYEANAIVEYLDEAYPSHGIRLFPGDARRRATVRRIVSEVDDYTTEATDKVIDELLYAKPEARDEAKLGRARAAVAEEFAFLARYLEQDFLAGPLSAADFALYPQVAYMDRCHQRVPSFDAALLLPPALAAWKRRIESLPYLDATIPPHWRAA